MWQNCWAAGRIVLGLTDDEFYRLTPRQYHLLIDQQEAVVQHSELLTGLVCSAIVNYSMQRGKTPAKATDYMPSYWKDKEPVKRKRKPSGKVLAAKVRAIFGPMVTPEK